MPSLDHICHLVTKFWFVAGPARIEKCTIPITIKWKPPEQSNIMLNTGCATHTLLRNHYALGGIFRNNSGTFSKG